MCVMSTIPTLNPQLNIANTNTKSKTTLNSASAGFAPITIKSNRTRVSPFRADKQLLNTELQKISKDGTRENFATMVHNLPNINKRSVPLKSDSIYNS